MTDLTPLQQQLRRQADALAQEPPSAPDAAALLAEHRRRARTRAVAGAAGSLAMLAVAVAAVLGGRALLRSPGFDNEATNIAVDDPSNDAPATITDEAIAGGDNSAVASTPPFGPTTMTPVIFTREVDGVEQVTAVGVYVPPQVEQLQLDDLSPAEQHAVRELLGLDEQTNEAI